MDSRTVAAMVTPLPSGSRKMGKCSSQQEIGREGGAKWHIKGRVLEEELGF